MTGSLEVSHVSWSLPGGVELLHDVSFRVGEGEHTALVGANGVGKTTMLRVLAGELTGYAGTIRVDGTVRFMRQLVGRFDDGTTVRDLMVAHSTPALQDVAATLTRREAAIAADPSEKNGVAYADVLVRWEQLGGYEAEVHWDECATRALGLSWSEVADRPARTLSGGEQKRLVLETLLRSDAEVLLLDEPDNFLDVPAKRRLAERLNQSSKTILYVSHDRELLAETSHRVVTLEGRATWTHGGSFATWHEARAKRAADLEDEHRRWSDERQRLHRHMKEMKRRAAMSDANASRARAAETRLRHYDEAGPPQERAKDQKIAMDLGGGRTGKRVVMAESLELDGLTYPFDLEVFYRDRVAVLGMNGTGKSHFLRLLQHDRTVAHRGELRLGARVEPGLFSQTHDHPELVGKDLIDVLAGYDLDRGKAMGRLRRYELDGCTHQAWETLSGGQQARFQILLLELSGATLLLLDEPTDNLDVASAEALEVALDAYEGTVVAVTHDRWFIRAFDRFVVFREDGEVTEILDPESAWV